MKAVKPLLIILVLAVAGWFLKGILFPSETDRIRRELADLDELVTFSPEDSNITRVARTGSIVSHFAQDIEIRVDGTRASVRGREDFREKVKAVLALSTGQLFDVQLKTPEIAVAPDKASATVILGAVVDLDDQRPLLAQEWKVTMRKEDREWKIAVIETIRVVSR